MPIINLGNRIVNTYICPVTNSYAMVDMGYEHVLKMLRKLNISIPEIKYIFLTHAHGKPFKTDYYIKYQTHKLYRLKM